MATIAAVKKQIFECEGFRVQLTPLTDKVKSLPNYDYTVSALEMLVGPRIFAGLSLE
jgi:hypothetical protein